MRSIGSLSSTNVMPAPHDSAKVAIRKVRSRREPGHARRLVLRSSESSVMPETLSLGMDKQTTRRGGREGGDLPHLI